MKCNNQGKYGTSARHANLYSVNAMSLRRHVFLEWRSLCVYIGWDTFPVLIRVEFQGVGVFPHVSKQHQT